MVILLGKNGSGKSTIKTGLVANGLKNIISYTTRQPRSNENEGIDYHFVSKTDFEKLICSGFFWEYQEYNGNYYGTATSDYLQDSVVVLSESGIRTLVEYESGLTKRCEREHISKTFYIDARLETRYKRMLSRGNCKEEIFSRIHKENFVNYTIYANHCIDNNSDDNCVFAIDEILRILNGEIPTSAEYSRKRTSLNLDGILDLNVSNTIKFLLLEEKLIEKYDLFDSHTKDGSKEDVSYLEYEISKLLKIDLKTRDSEQIAVLDGIEYCL